jgi:pimeloyl-ACP methyl ester carboxylesterase
MPVVSANGIEIAYDDRGGANDPVILLIMGLAIQMIAWPEAFCDGLAARGFRVIRFDNRDVGLSTKFDSAPPIDLAAIMQSATVGRKISTPYDLTDMAKDAVGLMDRLSIVAGQYPERVRSLVSVMSSSGDPKLPQAKPEAMSAIMQSRPPGSDRELAVQHGMKIYRAIGSPGFPTSDEELRAKVGAAFDRSYYPVGVGRQFAAILANGSRVEMLKRISVPTLVLHGADDPLVPVEAGRHTAAQIPGSKLKIIPGMGHDIPTGVIPILVNAIAAHCEAVRPKIETCRFYGEN